MASSDPIRVLPENVVNKIAAGEVVERPASVLKELVENAVDAGGMRIDVEVVAGGRKLVAVADNGAGLTRDDALLAIERHATSKITDVDDIEHIATLGFRGEALAAIAAVSRLRVVTCRAGDEAGTELILTGGKLQEVRVLGGPPGTRLEVRDLFFNVPARRKFLRSHQTELTHVRTAFLLQALAHPEIAMSLKVDGRFLYQLAASADASVEDRVRDLFGADYLVNLRAVDGVAHGIAVSGYISLPRYNRGDRSEWYVFVNGRAASAPVLNYAVHEGYHTLLPKGRYPAVFLFIRLPPEQVDVNVHPTKREVRFRRSGEIRDVLIETVRSALARGGADIGPANADPAVPPMPPAVQQAQLTIEDLPPARAFPYPGLPVADQPGGNVPLPTAEGAPAAPASAASDATSPWSWCRVVGQIGGLYVVLETEDGYVLMDPHAAHERVLFERFMARVLQGDVTSQSLLVPQTVELPPADALRVRKNADVLKQMGFGVSEFGGDSFVVDAVPGPFAGVNATGLLVEIAAALEQSGPRGAAARWREEAVAQAACKAAVKARDRLTLQEIEQLVVDLAGTEMPYTCPHGRPTLIFTSFHELNRKFARE